MSNLELAPAETVCAAGDAGGPVHERLVGREVPISKTNLVNRTLPHRDRRMIGAWCFVDHFGPDAVITMPGMRVPPHPHIGLQTVTWLVEGAVEHRDSLGTLQTITPGQLNLMTSGHGISHSEESPRDRPPTLHGVQLWVALPGAARDAAPRFEHLAHLPSVRIGDASVTVLMGELGGARSPATAFTPIVGAEVVLPADGRVELPVESAYEHGVLVVEGSALVAGGEPLEPGTLLYLGDGRDSIAASSTVGSRFLVLGGEPFAEEIVMWWNFVGRSHEDIALARADWMAGRFGADGSAPGASAPAARFGTVVGFDGDPLPAPALPNATLRARGRVSAPPTRGK